MTSDILPEKNARCVECIYWFDPRQSTNIRGFESKEQSYTKCKGISNVRALHVCIAFEPASRLTIESRRQCLNRNGQGRGRINPSGVSE
jgi:hypothetical protein